MQPHTDYPVRPLGAQSYSHLSNHLWSFFFFLFLLTIFTCEAILLHACYIHPVVPRFIRLFIHDLKNHWLELPWWYSGQESTCLFWGQGFDPWSGKIPHTEEQLGPCSTREATAMRSPCTTPRE